MTYTVKRDGEAQVLHLYGPRPFADLLTRAELEQVERGELIGISEHGGVMHPTTPLRDGAVVTLREPVPGDFAIFGCVE